MTEYLQKVKCLAGELAAAGRPMSIAEFNVVIYQNIDREFQSLSTHIRPEPKKVHSHLISHEILLKSYTSYHFL